MRYPKYDLTTSSQTDIFEFVSIGKKGNIAKMIQYCVTENPEFVNLAFGDKKMNDDGSYYIDDRIDSNNGDRDKVLATVAMSVYQYTSVYSNKYIVFAGSTDARTRLYRMAIAANFDELNSDYEIFGIVISKNGIILVEFSKNLLCLAFAVKRRQLINFENTAV